MQVVQISFHAYLKSAFLHLRPSLMIATLCTSSTLQQYEHQLWPQQHRRLNYSEIKLAALVYQHRLVHHEAECTVSVTTTSNMTSWVGQHLVRLLMIHQCHVDPDSLVTDHRHLDYHMSVSVTRPCKFLTQRHNSTRGTCE